MIIAQLVLADVYAIILKSKESAIRLVDYERTMMYWQLAGEFLKKNREEKIGLIMEIISRASCRSA